MVLMSITIRRHYHKIPCCPGTYPCWVCQQRVVVDITGAQGEL